MNSSVSTASASIAAFWEGVRCDDGRVWEDRGGCEWFEIACQAASLGVGRRREPGMMSAGGARERWPLGLLVLVGKVEGRAERGPVNELSEEELSLHLRVILEYGERVWLNGEAWERGDAEAMDSSSSNERVCQPCWTLTMAYFNLVRSCCPIWTMLNFGTGNGN
jgi:hypothetical protein